MGAIYIVRHGQADPSAYGVAEAADSSVPIGSLTDTGVMQAKLSGALLSSLVAKVDAAFTGTLPRQQQTLAAVLEQFPGAPAPVVEAGWDEYEIPDLTGAATVDDFRDGAAYQRLLDARLGEWIDGTLALPEGSSHETYAAYRERIRNAARAAAAEAGSGKTVLVASSAGTITALIAELWQVPDAHWPVLARTMVNASVTKLISGRSGLSVISFNEHAHLADLDGGVTTFR
ncbi:histidine phosphatase family protein [Gordonia sp. (in: high G+C Gram-positive bacteria)]|jgi:broad specificity phosphatase PhoE|uniref:histidine phosphatase family protein n=1 Tax=Gordonia sp. (in: high G+C Gram-positive bacteria) TaxID=84139 RepID=UPI001DCF1C96|nr:histidine phosphatase family protein [Gordonia sp. (in: high G+C Gram-positive bacteria)]MCB1296507.1 histidine phosphatase family protein [Gordonia sp. (in: high G+C Gram-positive bacteria)]HMS75552.1 histidine phosphatase family protein [Gordonia sp. (in: high G+C Gram-positive bacteria)]HQV17065.1 histidine phosphatase family protein [Gordonia sp. (in: high G+C Gram-positive bacteria)]